MRVQDFVLKRFNFNLKKNAPSFFIILLVDLIPLYALFYGHWHISDTVFLYLAETLILALIAFLKMRRAKYSVAMIAVRDVVEGGTKLRLGAWLSRIRIPGASLVGGSFRFLFLAIFLAVSVPLLALDLWLLASLSPVELTMDVVPRQHFLGIPLMWWVFTILFVEHIFHYRRKFIGALEFEKTGYVNEAVFITFRIFLQQLIVLVGLLAAVWTDASIAIVATIIIVKTQIDIASFAFNRSWGAKEVVERDAA